MRSLAIALLLSAVMISPAQAQTPDWMVGHWLSCSSGEQVSETWVGAGSGMLLGSSLTRASSRTSFEQLRVAPGSRGGLSYFASPNAAAATEFALVSHNERRVVFENPAHDFPQRIIYAREGDRLTARIEGNINGRGEAVEWRFRRARLDQNCRSR